MKGLCEGWVEDVVGRQYLVTGEGIGRGPSNAGVTNMHVVGCSFILLCFWGRGI